MATKRKVKRFNGEEESLALADENYGDGTTREERLAMVRTPEVPRNRNEGVPAPMDAMEAANNSAESQAIMDQAKGEAILKRMRDMETAPKRASTPRPAQKTMTKEALQAINEAPIGRAKASPDVLKPTPKAAPKADYSNEGRSRPAPSKANENYSNEGRSRPAPSSSAKKETYRDFSGKTREKSESERPDFGGAIGRGISNFFGSIRERGRKSNPEAYAKGGSVSSASKRGDGIAQKGKTRGKIC